MDTSNLSCIYTDGLTISNSSMLSTLALFYDEIYLPHPYDLNPDSAPLMNWPFKYQNKLEWQQKKYTSWLNSFKELSDEGIIKVLPAPISPNSLPSDFNEEFVKMTNFTSNYYSSSMVFDGYLALTVHALFSEENIPEWSLSSGQSGFSVDRDQIIDKWLSCRIPCYEELNSQQILELRDKLSPYQEGTRQYINSKLIKLNEILGNSNVEKDKAIELLVKSEIDTEMYDLEKRKYMETLEFGAGVIKRTAAFTGEVISTVALPWNWCNIFGLVEKFGDSVEHIMGHYKKINSKENTALQLVGKIESIQ